MSQIVTAPSRRLVPIRRAAPALAFFAVALVLTASRAIGQPDFSDEQLFLGGAGLMARGRGLIYRDFCYNHMPTGALVLSVLFRLTSRWLLAARMLDATCAAALAALIFEATRRGLAAAAGPAWRVALAAAVGGLFLMNPIAADAVGKAWNHDLAAMSCVLGYLLLAHALGPRTARPAAWIFASGACAAVGATTRLTFAPPLIGFAALLLLAPAPVGRWRRVAAWSAGLLAASVPSILVIAQAPRAAYFGNFRFPTFTAEYHARATVAARLLLSTKFDYARATLVDSASLLIFVALAVVAAALCLRPGRMTRRRAAEVGVVAMLAAAAASAFAPTPMFKQYLYGPMPFAALAIGWALPVVFAGPARRWAGATFLLVAAIAIARGANGYRSVLAYTQPPSSWTPMRRHDEARRITELAGPHAKVLTFAPGTALEGGHSIYSKLSIGRYGYRVGELLGKRGRKAFSLPSYGEVDGWFTSDPPDLVLLVEPQTPDERVLATFARRHGYRRKYFSPGKLAYLPPSRSTPLPTTQNAAR